MDAEKSSNSSFEDLSNFNETEVKTSQQNDSEGNVVEREEQIKTSSATSLLDNENRNLVQTSTSSTSVEKNDKIKTATNMLIDNERMESGEDRIDQKSSETFIDKEANVVTNEDDTISTTQSQDSMGKRKSRKTGSVRLFDSGSEEEDDQKCDILGNGQIIKIVLTKSESSERPKRGDLVTINFAGRLEDHTFVEKEENFQIHVGDYEVIQGLDMIIPLMNLKEIARVEIDPRFAYGSLGLKNESDPEKSIPPGAKLIYTIELVDIKDEEFSDLKSFEARRKYGSRKKERANFWYNRSEYNIAIQLYRRALDYLDDRDGDPDAAFEKEDLELSNSDLQTLLEDRLVVYNNMAMAQIKTSAFDAALKSVENVLRCQPNNSKALYRKGRILEGKGDVKGAISLLQKAAILEPESKAIQQDLAKLIIKARREEHNEKELYQKMLGQAKRLEMKSKQPQKQQSTQNSKAKLLGYLMGSILVGVAGVAIYRYKY